MKGPDLEAPTHAGASPDVQGAVDEIIEALDEIKEGAHDLAFIVELDNSEIGHVIESVPAEIRVTIWKALPATRYWPVLRSLQDGTVRHFVDSLPVEDIRLLTALADEADVLALADYLPEDLVSAILDEVDEDRIDALNTALGYEEDQVGRHMSNNIMKVRRSLSIGQLKQRLIASRENPPAAIFLIGPKGVLLGHLPYQGILMGCDTDLVETISLPVTGFADTDSLEVLSREVDSSDTSAWYPVIRKERVVGAVSAWSMLELLAYLNLETLTREAPSNEEDLFTPVMVAARMRAFWLLINLATAFLAASVIGLFEAALHEVVALAILMPVVASMGGIAGSQTLAIAIRGLALNHLSETNLGLVFSKEARIATLNGVILGILVGVVVWYWFDSVQLGGIIFTAILLNGLAAAYAGTAIPFWLKRLRIDPAVSGSVILTTVTDVVGFIVFLGLGSVVYLGF